MIGSGPAKGSRFIRWAALIAMGVLLTVGCRIGWLAYQFGSFSAATAHLRGLQLVFLPDHVDLGKARQGEQRKVELELVNLTDVPVQVLGAISDCSCVVVSDGLPVSLQGRGRFRLPVTVSFIGGKPDFAHIVTVYADCVQTRISARVVGHIRAAD